MMPNSGGSAPPSTKKERTSFVARVRVRVRVGVGVRVRVRG
jgi:hypothetical protein